MTSKGIPAFRSGVEGNLSAFTYFVIVIVSVELGIRCVVPAAATIRRTRMVTVTGHDAFG